MCVCVCISLPSCARAAVTRESQKTQRGALAILFSLRYDGIDELWAAAVHVTGSFDRSYAGARVTQTCIETIKHKLRTRAYSFLYTRVCAHVCARVCKKNTIYTRRLYDGAPPSSF